MQVLVLKVFSRNVHDIDTGVIEQLMQSLHLRCIECPCRTSISGSLFLEFTTRISFGCLSDGRLAFDYLNLSNK